MSKPRLNLRLSGDVYAKLDDMTRRPGVTKSAIIEQALREYFNPEIRQGMEERILKRLDRFDVRQGHIERDVSITLEALGQYVFYWLTRTDPLPEDERDAAHALGQRRFNHFIEQVGQKITSNDRLSVGVTRRGKDGDRSLSTANLQHKAEATKGDADHPRRPPQ